MGYMSTRTDRYRKLNENFWVQKTFVVFEFSLKAVKKRLKNKEVNHMQNVNFVTALSRTWLLGISLSRASEVLQPFSAYVL